jgi:protein gp37
MPRRLTGEANGRKPFRWNELARREKESGVITPGWESWGVPGFWPVFANSLSDVFDNEVDPEWRADLFDLISQTPHLTWILLTKRVGNVANMLPVPFDFERLYPNVWIGATIVSQKEADRDIPVLLRVPATKLLVSYEPGLELVDFSPYLTRRFDHCIGDPHGDCMGCDPLSMTPTGSGCMAQFRRRLDWLIVGGESDQPGMPARPFDVGWARSAVRQCLDVGVPPFVKQLGGHVVWNGCSTPGQHWPHGTRHSDTQAGMFRMHLRDRAGADSSEWPEDLRVRYFP